MDCIDENNRRSYWSEEAESCCRSDRETGFGTHVVVTGGNTCPPKKSRRSQCILIMHRDPQH